MNRHIAGRKTVNKYKYLFKNIGLLALSSFATKLLSFFLVPLYTNILTTTEYGTYDLLNTTIGVLLPILTLNIQESVMRFALDKQCDRKAIATISVKYLIISNVIVAVGLISNYCFDFNGSLKKYAVLFFLMFFSQALSGMVIAYVRGIDKITELSVSSVIAAIGTISLNILFLAVFKWGLIGYFLSNIIGPFLQSMYLIVKSGMLKNICFKKKYKDEQNQMLAYCKPLIANSIAWWVNNTSDRYIVIFFCGLSENGIYSVASKIPSILNIVQTIFNQAWTLSAVKDFDAEDSAGFFSNTYRAYNCLMVVACSFIIAIDKELARFLYAKDFYIAWKYVPWLTIAIVFGALSGYIGGLFSAVRNSKIFAQSTIIGALLNIVLNLIFTPIIGALGAAIATTVSYIVVWLIRLLNSKRYITLKIKLGRDLGSYFVLIIQSITLIIVNERVLLVELILFVVTTGLYFDEIKSILERFLEGVKVK